MGRKQTNSKYFNERKNITSTISSNMTMNIKLSNSSTFPISKFRVTLALKQASVLEIPEKDPPEDTSDIKKTM